MMYLPPRTSLVFHRGRTTRDVFNFVAASPRPAPTALERGNVAASPRPAPTALERGNVAASPRPAPTALERGNVAVAHFATEARTTFGEREYWLSTVAYSYAAPVLVILRNCVTGEAHTLCAAGEAHTLCAAGEGWSRTTAKHISAFRSRAWGTIQLPLPLSASAADQIAALVEASAKSLARALRARLAHRWYWDQYTNTLQNAQTVATLAGLPNPLAEGAPHQRLEGAALAKLVALRLRGALPANA